MRPTPTPMPSFTSYVVKPGDSLTSIGRRFKTTGRSIAFWNRATYPSLDPDSSRYSPNSIKVGWTLLLIPGVLYDENAGPEPTDVPVPTRRPSDFRLAYPRPMSESERPRIVVTVTVPARHPDPDLSMRKNRLYAEAVERHGGAPIVVDGSSSADERAAAFAAMDGLLLSGGADIDPARYGAPNLGSLAIEPERDELEAAAWAAAEARGVPVLGICRGFQAINVFAGGTLLQHVAGHEGPGWSKGPAVMHPMRLDRDARLGSLVAPDGAADVTVNTYHHQAVRPADLAPGLVATGWAASAEGDLVEALELPGSRFVVGVQCHPERTESTPSGFDALWLAFMNVPHAGRSSPRRTDMKPQARGLRPRAARRRSPAGGTGASALRAAR